jgi:hypothetical protein
MFNTFLAFGDFDEMGELFKELETLKWQLVILPKAKTPTNVIVP